MPEKPTQTIDGRAVVLSIKGTAAYSEWLREFATSRTTSVLGVIEQAVAGYAHACGFRTPPSRTNVKMKPADQAGLQRWRRAMKRGAAEVLGTIPDDLEALPPHANENPRDYKSRPDALTWWFRSSRDHWKRQCRKAKIKNARLRAQLAALKAGKEPISDPSLSPTENAP